MNVHIQEPYVNYKKVFFWDCKNEIIIIIIMIREEEDMATKKKGTIYIDKP